MRVRATGRRALEELGRQSSALAERVEQRLGLTAAGTGAVVLSLAALVLGRSLASPALTMLGYGGAVVVGLGYALGRRTLRITSARSDLPGRVRAGQALEVRVELEVARRLSTVVVEERLDLELGPTVRVPLALAAPGERVTHDYRLTPRQRGVYRVGPLVATWSDPFGLTRRRQVLTEPVELVVHPRVEPARDRVVAREWEDPPVRPPVTRPWPTGYEFYGLRDYVPGDDPRRIVWRATARSLDVDTGRGRYLVRESEQGVTDRVAVLLDDDRGAHSPGRPSETFEAGVRVVAALASRHVEDGLSVATHLDGGRLHPPVRSRRETIPLLDALARLQPGRDRLAAGLERLVRLPRRELHLTVVTPRLDAAATGRLTLLRERGTHVVLVLLVWPGTDPLTLRRAAQLRVPVVEVGPTTPLAAAFRRVLEAPLVLR